MTSISHVEGSAKTARLLARAAKAVLQSSRLAYDLEGSAAASRMEREVRAQRSGEVAELCELFQLERDLRERERALHAARATRGAGSDPR